jgi:hypothetical protein
LICNTVGPSDSNIPSASGTTVNSGGTTYNTAWGVATSGALLFSSISMNSVDPYFPAVYGSVTNAASEAEKVDFCQAHP